MSDHQRPPTKPIAFRAPLELVAAARDRADREDTTWPAAMRALLYDYAIGRCSSPTIARECVRIARHLRAIGRNLNQIARVLNTQPPTLDMDTVSALVTAIVDLRDFLEHTHKVVLARQLPTRPWWIPALDR